jgi:TRAP-type transport system periplasmic protein
MKRIITSAIMIITGVLLAYTPSFCSDRPKTTIKIATIAPKGSSMMNSFEDLAEEVRQKTNNEVAFKIYWGGVQGDEKDVLRKIKLGQLHGGGFMGVGLGQIVPEVRVTEIPYVFKNHEEVSYVRSELKDTMNSLFEEKGYIVLGWLDLGFVYTFSKIPIDSLEVARAQKWWTLEGDPIGRSIYKELDISPISLSITDVATSLSTNLIDCANSTPYGAVAFQWYSRFSYMGEYPATSILGATIITKKVFDKISAENQKIIMDVAKSSHERIEKAARAENDKCLQILKDSGIQVVRNVGENSENQMVYITEAAKRARDSLVGELYTQELLDRTLSLLDTYRKAHPENNSVVKID